jgi:hypothetical protein
MQAESVKAYLLGLLDEESSAAVEERFFCDRTFFLRLAAEEKRLIADYIAGHLPENERRAFETRCKNLPALSHQVDIARAEFSARAGAESYRRLVVPLLAATVLLAVASILWMKRGDSTRIADSNPPQPRPPAVSVETLTLAPGTYMDGDSSLPHLPYSSGIIQIRIDLPGQIKPVTGQIRVWFLSADGNWKTHWTSNHQSVSEATAHGQQIVLELAGSQLPPGEYRAEILSDPPSQVGFRRFRIDRPRN